MCKKKTQMFGFTCLAFGDVFVNGFTLVASDHSLE